MSAYLCLFEDIVRELIRLGRYVQGRQEGHARLAPMDLAPDPRPQEEVVEQPQDGLLQVGTHSVQREVAGQRHVDVLSDDFHRVGRFDLGHEGEEQGGSPHHLGVGGEVGQGGSGHFYGNGVLNGIFGIAYNKQGGL